MKSYYVETVIEYYDNSIDESNPVGENPYEGSENISFIIQALDEYSALYKTFDRSISEFKKEYSDECISIKSFFIETIYETVSDTRTD